MMKDDKEIKKNNKYEEIEEIDIEIIYYMIYQNIK